MAIRLETALGTGIDNYHSATLPASQIAWSKRFATQFPDAVARTAPSATYNCHGLTFASRRTCINKSRDLQRILRDDGYEEVSLHDTIAGDIVIYSAVDGDLNHSGVVVASGAPLVLPLVCSKWGNAGEYLHGLTNCPTLYGPITTFYRCRR